MGVRGFVGGVLSLVVLHALVARADQRQLSGLVATANGLLIRFLSPDVPAIPKRGAGHIPLELTKVASDAQAAGKKVIASIPTPTRR
jgi:hypothetical protein